MRAHLRDVLSRDVLSRQPRGNFRNFLLVSSVAALAGWVAYRYNVSRQQAGELRHKNKRRDKALVDSFPASDPPASQNFDIPVNRL